jgi:leucyl aminopeptidase
VVAVVPRATPQTTVTTRRGSLLSAIHEGSVDGVAPDVVGVAIESTAVPGPAALELAEAYRVDLAAVIAGERVTGKAGEVVRVPVLAPNGLPARFLLVGVGGATAGELRRAAAALGRAGRGNKHVITTLGDGASAESVCAVIEGALLGSYLTPSAGQRSRDGQTPAPVITLVGDHSDSAVARGLAHARATVLARDLSEMPSNVKTPAWLAEQARELGEAAGLSVEVWDEDRLRAEGFGGVLAVGSGSTAPPRFVRLDYRPDGDPGGSGEGRSTARAGRVKPIVLVGKGITYDTGGISIKPREAMVPMKTDMSGAAAVLAALLGCRDLGVRRPVIGLLPLAENAFGAASYRPGDVVTIHGGTTVEILNTDAEGRIVLADALAYAATQLDPEVIVDVATLTGAASQGLGRRHAALFTGEDRLAAALTAAADDSGELVWRLPLVEDYRAVLDSPIADLRHVPGKGGAVGGGSITAALFLREFVAGHRWAHLDIAGPARSDREEHEVTRGATGFGARLLLRWLESVTRSRVS